MSSEEEAKRAPIDNDGSTYVFPLTGGNVIYTKQMDTTTYDPIFRMYKPVEMPTVPEPPVIDTVDFANRAEVEGLRETVATLQAAVDKLQEAFLKPKEAKK